MLSRVTGGSIHGIAPRGQIGDAGWAGTGSRANRGVEQRAHAEGS